MSKNTWHEPCFYEKDLSALNLLEALQMTLKFWLIIRSALFKHSYNKNSKKIDQHCDYTPLINRMHIANISSIKPEAYLKTQFFLFPFVSGRGGGQQLFYWLYQANEYNEFVFMKVRTSSSDPLLEQQIIYLVNLHDCLLSDTYGHSCLYDSVSQFSQSL